MDGAAFDPGRDRTPPPGSGDPDDFGAEEALALVRPETRDTAQGGRGRPEFSDPGPITAPATPAEPTSPAPPSAAAEPTEHTNTVGRTADADPAPGDTPSRRTFYGPYDVFEDSPDRDFAEDEGAGEDRGVYDGSGAGVTDGAGRTRGREGTYAEATSPNSRQNSRGWDVNRTPETSDHRKESDRADGHADHNADRHAGQLTDTGTRTDRDRSRDTTGNAGRDSSRHTGGDASRRTRNQEQDSDQDWDRDWDHVRGRRSDQNRNPAPAPQHPRPAVWTPHPQSPDAVGPALTDWLAAEPPSAPAATPAASPPSAYNSTSDAAATAPADAPLPATATARPSDPPDKTRHHKATPTPTHQPPGPHPMTPAPSPPNPPNPHSSTPWPQARNIAERAGNGRRPTEHVPLDRALGLVLAAPVPALTDLPPFDTSAMDGWAVAGPGPWQVREGGALAGHAEAEGLEDGVAVRIATGARVPYGATSVLRSEHGRTEADGRRLHATRNSGHGQDIRPRGQECRAGDQLLPESTVVSPAVLGLAAAAGYDELAVVPRPRVEVLVLGDELLSSGLPREGLIRDALGPMLPSWLRALGAEVTAVRRLGDDAEALRTAMESTTAEVIVSTGGTASGPVDHVHPTLRALGAQLLVDGVEVRPGHPMLLARLGAGRHLVGLPGNPLAAVSGLLTLAEPLLRALSGRLAPPPYTAPLREAVHGHPHDTRLIPVALRAGEAVPLHFSGPAMLRGIAGGDAMAVVPPGGGEAGAEVRTLDLPWAALSDGACFT